MGKGSDAPTSTTSTVYNNSLPEYARPYYERLMSRTEAETNQPYIPFPGQRIQGFSADQLGSFQGIRNLNAMGAPTLDTAAQMATQAGGQALQAGSYTPIYAGTQTWPGADVSQYMNPYIDNVLNRLQSRATERYGEQSGMRQTAAERAGAYGGSRQGIQDFLAQRELNQQLGDMEAQQLSQAYQNAQGMFTSDQGRVLQALLANQGVDLQSAQLGLQGAQTAGTMSDILGRIGTSQQGLTLDRIRALQDAGSQQQGLLQRGLDTSYQDFVNQRDFERQNLNFLSGILHGVPVSPQSEVITTSPGPNPLSQLLGSGIAVSSLANMGGSQ